MSHSMKLYEHTIEGRLRRLVNISEEQFGFMKGKSTKDAIFALRQVQEKYREGHKELHSVFIQISNIKYHIKYQHFFKVGFEC